MTIPLQPVRDTATDQNFRKLGRVFPLQFPSIANVVGPVFNVKSYKAAGDGVSDDTTAFQSAVNAVDGTVGGVIYVPPGAYVLSAPITKTTAGDLTVIGAGQGCSKLIQTADADLFNITLPSASTLLHFEKLRLVAGHTSSMTTGAAIRVVGNFSLPTVTGRDVFIYSSGSCDWKYGTHLTDCTESVFDSVTVYGLGAVNGFYLTSSNQPSASHLLHNCSVYGGEYGLRVETGTTPGVEGVQVTNCDFVNVDFGVHSVNTAVGYGAPQTSIMGGHINASDECVHLEGGVQGHVNGVLLYNSGSSQMIGLSDASYYTISNNIFVVISSGDPDGIYMEAPSGGTGSITIADNRLVMKSGGTGYCVRNSSDVMNNISIHDNKCSVAGAGFADFGYIDGSFDVRGNTPLDSDDIHEVITAAATISIADKRSSYFTIPAPGGATTITKITPRNYNDQIILKCDSNLVTLQHNAGILLKGAANLTFSTGSLITLRMVNGGWIEVSRSV